DAAAVHADPRLDVEIDHALDRDQHFHVAYSWNLSGDLDLGDDLLRRVAQVVGGDDRQAAHRQDVLALLDVGAFEADDQRHLDVDLARGLDDAFGNDVAAHDAAEDVDEDALHGGIAKDDLEGGRHLLLRSAAADVEEV